jgi:serine/threonine-protein kinase
MAWQVGERVGDYEIIQALGAGGMGQVYKVRNVISDRVEAMKILLPDLAGNLELAERFMREIKVQASLDHPNIAALHTAQRVGNQLVMVMEFVEGQTIESLLRTGPLPLNQAISYTQQVLSALAYAHARGIVHRDIKPPNIMLTSNGTVKLMDFGIAKLSADPKLTQTGHTVGSLYYMSPEQINGAALDPRSDLYSLGVTLYEMVTGRRPFQGDSDYSIMSAHLLSKPVPPVQLDPRVPDALNEIILMSIAKDPGQRFQTADAFRAALGNAAVGLGVAPALGATAAIRPMPPPPPIAQHAPTVQMGVPVPPPATGPVPVAAVIPAAAAPIAAAPPSGSRRALYMALGSVATVLVLIAAAVEAPKLFRSSGASSQVQGTQAPLTTTPPAQPTVTQEQPVQQPQPQQSAQPQDTAVQQPSETSPAPRTVEPVVRAPQTQSRHSALGQPAAQVTPQVNAAVPQQQPASPPPVQSAPPQQAEQPVRTAPPPANGADMSELREQLMLLGTRASAAQGTIKTMQSQQARSGLGMRQDIVAAMDRMNAYMGEAESSLRSGDTAKGKRYLNSAERELEKLEKFLGR